VRKVNVSDARRQFGKPLRRTERGERTAIYRHNKLAAVLVPIHDLELIEQLSSKPRAEASKSRKT